MTEYINFDKAKTERLRKAYKLAVKDQQEQFTFEGKEYLTKYAYYLLQYLDTQLKGGAKP
jgi:hypothetical protein